ncbi:MAG: PEP-CTERM sorting domain-containing protein [Planctomycetota bacterium]
MTATDLGFQNDTNDLNDFRFHFNSVASAQGGQFAIDNTRWTTDANTLVFDVVPEPSSLALLSVGSLMMIKRRQRA